MHPYLRNSIRNQMLRESAVTTSSVAAATSSVAAGDLFGGGSSDRWHGCWLPAVMNSHSGTAPLLSVVDLVAEKCLFDDVRINMCRDGGGSWLASSTCCRQGGGCSQCRFGNGAAGSWDASRLRPGCGWATAAAGTPSTGALLVPRGTRAPSAPAGITGATLGARGHSNVFGIVSWCVCGPSHELFDDLQGHRPKFLSAHLEVRDLISESL